MHIVTHRQRELFAEKHLEGTIWHTVRMYRELSQNLQASNIFAKTANLIIGVVSCLLLSLTWFSWSIPHRQRCLWTKQGNEKHNRLATALTWGLMVLLHGYSSKVVAKAT